MYEVVLAAKANIQLIALIAIIAAAWRWGDAPEMACAAALGFMSFADWPYHAIFGHGAKYSSVDVGHAVIDVTTAAILYVIALNANRVYPLWLTAFQLISVLSHGVKEVTPKIGALVYSIMIVAPSYFELIILGFGILAHVKRKRRYGPYKPWLKSPSHFSRTKASESHKT